MRSIIKKFYSFEFKDYKISLDKLKFTDNRTLYRVTVKETSTVTYCQTYKSEQDAFKDLKVKALILINNDKK